MSDAPDPTAPGVDEAEAADRAVLAPAPAESPEAPAEPAGTTPAWEADEVLVGSIALAQRALLEVTAPETVGSVIGHVAEGEHVVSLHFAADLAGYPGWHWSVTLARVEGGEPTVLETELLPGGRALLAPEWVPWSERLAEYRAAQAAAAADAAARGEGADDDGEAGESADEVVEESEGADEPDEEFADDTDDADDDDVFDGIDIDALADDEDADDDESEDGESEDESDESDDDGSEEDGED